MSNISTSTKQSIIDKIIGNHFDNEPGVKFRVRILATAWVLFFCTLMLTGAFTAALPMKLEARVSAIGLCGTLSACLLYMILSFNKSGNYRLYGHVSVGIAFVGLSISVCLAESVLTSPSLGLIYIIPVLAVFFLGKKSGWQWSFVTLLLLAIFLIAERFGLSGLAFYDDAFLLEARFSTDVMGMVGLLGMVITYESSNRKLRVARDEEYKSLEFLANHDQLTGLLNRISFERRIEQSIDQLGLLQKNEKLALLYMDLDGFKPVNDKYGHKAGDIVLKVVSERIQLLLEGSGYAARHGGDEFILLLDHVKSSKQAMIFAQQVLNEISRPVMYEDIELKVTASLGVAFFPKDAQDFSMLMRRADAAMYQAKVNKNGVVRFQEEM